MKKIALAILTIILTVSLNSCDKECVCSIREGETVVESAVVGEMSKEECDSFIWVLPVGTTYNCTQN